MDMTKDQRIRLLRAKSGELEARFANATVASVTGGFDELAYLMADLALVFELLADHMESTDG